MKLYLCHPICNHIFWTLGAELSTDHQLVVRWIRGRMQKIQTRSADELGISGGATCPSGLQALPQKSNLGDANDAESEWTMFKASIVKAMVRRSRVPVGVATFEPSCEKQR